MIRFVIFLGCFGMLAGCVGNQPQPYSPNYSYLSMNDAKPGVVRKGYDKVAAQTILVPDACITPDTADDPVYLPSGCSNNLNLQHMAARKQDLLQGREMGPAMAAPVARAAQNYIDGTVPEERRQRRRTEESSQPAQ
jgi:type IV pilus biogenesis protein CpaD/CtpE